MSDSISKTVPAVIKERKHIWAKPCIKSKNMCKDGFASPKANEHGGYDNITVIVIKNI